MKRISNPPNPFLSRSREYLEEIPQARVEVYEEQAKSILSENDSPDLPFRWSVNPYRGCQHACAYCYARPYHHYVDLGAGTDFDTKLFVKTNAPDLLVQAFRARRWRRECINFSGVTDCYQPLEAVYEVTRRCLEVCRDHANPAGIVTKGYLVARDADLLVELNARAGAEVYFSIPFADDTTARLIEPHAPPPSRRFAAMQRLHQAGVPVHVFMAPIIPGLNDSDVPAVLERASLNGAECASFTALRLPGAVEAVFLERLRAALPLRAQRIENRLREIRGGRTSESAFGQRMTGAGIYWDSIAQLFRLHAARCGLNRVPDGTPLRRMPAAPADEQMELF
jgi:DNA repair photolyase